MEEACRICFATNLKMVVLDDSQEKDFLEGVFLNHGLEGEMIESLCYLCKALLTKSYRFFQKAVYAQQGFLNKLYIEKNVTKDTWDSLRDEYKYSSILSYHRNIGIDVFIHEAGEYNPYDQVRDVLQKIERNKNVSVSKYSSLGTENQVSSDVDNDVDIKNALKNDVNIKNEDVDNDVDMTISNYFEYCQSSVPKIPKKGKPKRKKKVFYVYADEENKEPQQNFTEINPVNVVMGKRNRATKTFSYEDLLDSDMPLKKPKSRKKGRIIGGEDKEFTLDDISQQSESDSSHDIEMYTEKGKKLSEPPREYPRQCENCDTEISIGSEHYRHYLVHHTHEMYPYKKNETEFVHVCHHCGKKYSVSFRSQQKRKMVVYCTATASFFEKAKICNLHFKESDYDSTGKRLRIGAIPFYKETNVSVEKQYRLKVHIATHGQKTIPCLNLCGKMFHNSVQMRKHFSAVHKDRKVFCDYCNKGFANKSDLRLHLRLHTREKPFKCQICGAGFAHLGNLNIHLRHGHVDMDDNGKGKSFRSRPRKNNNALRKRRAGKGNVTNGDESKDEIVKPAKSIAKKRKLRTDNEKVERTEDVLNETAKACTDKSNHSKTGDKKKEQQKEEYCVLPAEFCKSRPRKNNVSRKRRAKKRNESVTNSDESDNEIVKPAKSYTKKRNI